MHAAACMQACEARCKLRTQRHRARRAQPTGQTIRSILHRTSRDFAAPHVMNT